jgi:ATP-dependent Lon protease
LSISENEVWWYSKLEKFVGVPEQGGRDMISTDPLAPGSVYAASVDDQGKVGLCRLEVGCSPGTGKLRIEAGLVVLGDLSIQGNIKSVRSLVEPLQVAMDNGARRALVPLENKRNFLEVSGDIVERVDPIFFSDPMTAAMKALGMA